MVDFQYLDIQCKYYKYFTLFLHIYSFIIIIIDLALGFVNQWWAKLTFILILFLNCDKQNKVFLIKTFQHLLHYLKVYCGKHFWRRCSMLQIKNSDFFFNIWLLLVLFGRQCKLLSISFTYKFFSYKTQYHNVKTTIVRKGIYMYLLKVHVLDVTLHIGRSPYVLHVIHVDHCSFSFFLVADFFEVN